MTSLLFTVSRTSRDTTTIRLSATLMTLSPTSKKGICAKEVPLDSGTCLFYTLKCNPVFGLVLHLL